MYTRILVPVDGRAASKLALYEAIRLATGTHAVLVTVAIASGFVGATELASTPSFPELAAATELVESAAVRARAAGVRCEEVVVDRAGRSLARALLDEGAARSCDLIGMGVPGRCGLTRVALGNEAESLVRRARIPVMLVHAATMERARRSRRARLRTAEPLAARLPDWLEPRPPG